MTTITPCLLFDGDAEAAMKFYRSIFKSMKILKILRQDGKFTCGWVRLQGHDFMFLNGGKEKFTPAISFMVTVRTQREVDNLWAKLSKGGKEIACSWLRDKYGVRGRLCPSSSLIPSPPRTRRRPTAFFKPC